MGEPDGHVLGGSPQILSMGARMDCASTMMWCGARMQELSRVMEASSDEWHGVGVLQLSQLQSAHGHNRRADAHLRASVAASSRQRTASASQATALGIMDPSRQVAKLQRLRMAVVHKTMLSSGLPGSAVFSCWDAGRIGAPAKELLVHMLAAGDHVLVLSPAMAGKKHKRIFTLLMHSWEGGRASWTSAVGGGGPGNRHSKHVS